MSMRQFNRGDTPPVLTEHGEAWGREWEQRQKAGGTFHWHKVVGQSVNQSLVPILAEQTQGHCSFCDAYPVSPPSLATIEHFCPKSKFPLLAFVWDNLYDGLNNGHPIVRRLERDKVATAYNVCHADYPYRNFLFQEERISLTPNEKGAS